MNFTDLGNIRVHPCPSVVDHRSRGPPSPSGSDASTKFNEQRVLTINRRNIMELREKLELKREITEEVKDDLTRYAGRRITSRILLALAIITFELLLWTLIVVAVIRDTTVSQGLATCLLICWLRVFQLWLISLFNEK